MKKCETVSYKKSKEHFTEVRFKLDLDRFKLSELNYGTIKMIEAKVIAMSAYNNGLTVSFNGEDYKFKSLLDYVKLYGFNDSEIIYEKNDDWEHCITPNIDANGYHIGLINGALCCDGEIKKHHEKATVDSIRKFLKTPTFKKYNDGETIEPTYQSITQRFNSFVKAEVINPEYDSQSKDKLTTSPLILDGDKYRDRKFNIDKKINVEFATIGSLIDWYTQKKNAEEAGEVRKKVRELKKKDVKSVRKLVDATSKTKSTRAKCDLFIFEGDSAGKSFRSTREPKTQGALFLRGKCKQAYGMTTLNVLKNEEFSNIVLALGLDPTKPDEVDNLRFRRVIICTDADRDGDGICGQLLTFFMVHFPKLVEKGMIYRSTTPLYVASKGKQRKYFYSQSEFDSFKGKGWTTKYMKGLGSLLKEHYKHILTEPRLIRFKSTDDTFKIITDWMGKNSTMRKQYLSQKVE
ncbi:DNA gyrase/topoisomerase IV, subunit B [Tenacibaculum phage PTm5]|uniref:DNA topoisomerase (ATP-hydrolyzing) n=1 Tax=Tenacibaculum phage PTm5 TaxID=2547426 RepID=A0A5S9HXS3_9CAUD|nr:DNA gyrase/topoisomerase IV, subunit B [Tenacibaculum phage PTm5]